MKLCDTVAWLLSVAAVAAADIASTVCLRSETTCSEATLNATASVPAPPPGSPAELRELSGVSDAQVCSVECAVWSQCVFANYRPGNRTCLLGNLGAWQPCSIQPLTVMRKSTPPMALLSRLLALYSFRFGLDNLVAAVAPGTALPSAVATSGANFIYGRGVKLTGSFTSYLDVNLTGLGGRPLSGTGRATFYARMVPESSLGIVVHTVFNNSYIPGSTGNHSGRWYFNSLTTGDAQFEAHDLSPLVFTTSNGFNTYAPTGTAQSVAVVFDSANGAKFYLNGAWVAGMPTSTTAGILAKGEEVLRIGCDMFYPFVGLMLCYAVAADNLTLAELQQLDKAC